MSSTHAEAEPEPSVAISHARVLICGVARNCEQSIANSVAALYDAAKQFGEVRFHIVESDSSDGTIRALGQLSELYPLTFQSEGKLRRTMPLRTERIAYCRNQLVDLVRASEFGEIDFVLMADLDGLNESISAEGLSSCWEVQAPWGVLTANQPNGYYDIWALRHSDWMPGDCWENYRSLEPKFGKKIAKEIAVSSRQIAIPTSARVIEVDSAFGGLGLYRTTAFLSGKYRGTNPDGSEICEHVPFHAQLRGAGHRIFINPAFVNSTPQEHVGLTIPLLKRLFRKFRTLVSNV